VTLSPASGRRRLLLGALLALLHAVLTLAPAAAAPGDLDRSFGDDGSVVHAVDGQSWHGGGVVAALPQPGRRTLLVGAAYPPGGDDPRVALVRLDADGSVDESYGTDGIAWLPEAAGHPAIEAVALPDGGVAVLADGSAGLGESYVLTRVDADGTPDDGFGAGGVVEVPFAELGDDCSSTPVACQASGRALALYGDSALVVAVSGARTSVFESVVVRHELETGARDVAFGGGDGIAELGTPSGLGWRREVTGVAVEPLGGRIVVAEKVSNGALPERGVVHRLDDDGAVDGTFGDGGIAAVRFRPDVADEDPGTEDLTAVAALPDGRVAVAARVFAGSLFPGEQHGAVAVLSDLGELDTTFGDDGVALVAHHPDGENGFDELEVLDGALHAGGTTRSWAAGGSAPDGPWQSWLVRFDDTGVDAEFGGASGAAGGQMEVMTGLAATDDGFAVAGGTVITASDWLWAAARFELQADRPPVNEEPPAVREPFGPGSAEDGDELEADAGTWLHAEDVTRAWQRCDGAHAAEAPAAAHDCTAIPGADGATYRAAGADVGKHVRVVETATSDAASATAASATVAVGAAAARFVDLPVVEPSGSVPAGTLVRATWSHAGTEPIAVAVRWQRCAAASGGSCQAVTGDDTSDDAYTTTAADAGSWLQATVELAGPGGTASAHTTNRTRVGAAASVAAPRSTGAPAIAPAGSVVEGTVLSRASDGAWDQAGLTFTYRWERCSGTSCSAIPGAGGSAYTTTGADAGRSVRLVVSARKGTGPVGTAASAATAVTARPVPPPPPPPPAPAPANPFGLTGTVVTQDTTRSAVMPDVRGLPVDAAKDRIERAGIHAVFDVKETVRSQPLKLPGKPRLDIGDVSAQSLAAGVKVTTTIASPRKIRLTAEAGPKASAANGGPSGPVCTGAAARADLKGLGLGEVFDLLRAKRCTRVEVDFTVSSSAREVEVRSAVKDGKDLELRVTVPSNPGRLDLTPIFRQGAFNSRPSFGRDDWALTAGAMNVMGVQVVDRAGRTVDGAEVYLDASKVGADDVDGTARGGIFVSGLRPAKAGVVNVLVAQRDAAGSRIFGFGRFRVVDRKSAFTAIDGRRYSADGAPLGGGAAVARAAVFGDLLAAIGRLAQDLGAGVSRLFAAGATDQTITTAARQNVGVAQLSLGEILNGRAGVVAAGGANVVAVGGGNVVAAGGGNVVAAGGGNLVSLASGGVVAAGGGNLLGRETIKSGTGALMPLPAQVVAVGGGNVVAVGGGNVVAVGGGNVVAAGGLNLLSTRSGG
jgi:uncharacterized delta-60 repeat protein